MSILFTPIRLRNIEIPNRLVLPAMTGRLANPEGFVTEEIIAYYTERARHGVGLIIVEMCSSESVGRHRVHELGIYDERFSPGLKRLAQAIKETGAKAAIQLGHGGGQTREDITGEHPIAPSAVEYLVEEIDTRRVIPHEMDKRRIQQAVQAFAEAAVRAKEAGFDAIELHGAHGYLIFQFLSPLDNVRTDEYGGCLKNRARFALDVLKACRSAIPSLPIIFRLSIQEYARGGLTAEEGVQVAEWIAEAGANAIHVSSGSHHSLPSAPKPVSPMIHEPGIFVPLASMVKKKVNIPVIAVGRLDDPTLAEKVLISGHSDMIAIGRGLIADPEWPLKVRKGTAETIRVCLACNTCINTMHQGKPLRCLVNPCAGREKEITLSPSHESKSILVVGGGLSGLEAARVLSMRGYKVTLVERKSFTGGSLRLAMKAPIFQNVEVRASQIEKFLEYQVRAAEAAGVEILTSASVDKKVLNRVCPDVAILAAGASNRFPLNFLIPLLLKSPVAKTSLFKKILTLIHRSPKLGNLFYRTLRKRNTRILSLFSHEGLKFYVIGDCLEPGTAQEAILSAVQIAVKV